MHKIIVLYTLTTLITAKILPDKKKKYPNIPRAASDSACRSRSAVPTIRNGMFRDFRQALWANAGIVV